MAGRKLADFTQFRWRVKPVNEFILNTSREGDFEGYRPAWAKKIAPSEDHPRVYRPH